MSNIISKVDSNIVCIQNNSIPGCLTNAYVITSNKANYVIDTGLGSNTAKIINNCLDNTKQVYVINTHYHWDHIWGNPFIDNNPVYICHEQCFENIADKWFEMIEKNSKYKDGEIDRSSINILFKDTISMNNELEVFHTPGHTNDSISILFNKSLFVGDLVGDTDEELVPSLCDKDHFVESLKKCISKNGNAVYSGHNSKKDKNVFIQIMELYNQSIA